ncbi:hypothetical protein [Vibrio vulnificus YJ016]|uniref:Uncharacterized protein n=1 Tax=Vibrio vulnificus (strain YJ016) TaxID=196600 RepID=Q7MH74_VIBVY|nr:hypothetical protein [Vibrio vulnificus YJ016]
MPALPRSIDRVVRCMLDHLVVRIQRQPYLNRINCPDRGRICF